jgi:hypothetical protein
MITALVHLVIYIIVLGLVVWLLLYLIDVIPLPEPFSRIARIAVMVIGILIAILVLLQFAGIVEPGALR